MGTIKCEKCGTIIPMDGEICGVCKWNKVDAVKKLNANNRIIGIGLMLFSLLFLCYFIFIEKNPILILILKKLGLL